MVDGAGGFDEFFGPGDRLVILDQITEPSRVCGDGGGVIAVAMVGSRVRPLPAGVAGDGAARLRDRQFTRSAGCSALAGVRNLGLNDPSPDRPDSHCNFGGVTLGAEVVRELTIGVPG